MCPSGEPQKVWENKEMRNHFGTCVLINGYLYGIDGQTSTRALLKCVEFQTGALQWKKYLRFATLTAADDKLIILNDRGVLYIVTATPSGYRQIAQSLVLPSRRGVNCWTVPVLCRGMLYCRNSGRKFDLYRFKPQVKTIKGIKCRRLRSNRKKRISY